MIKLTFLGDIICQYPFMRAAVRHGMDFRPAFSHLGDFLAESDFVVANLETPVAGERAGFTDRMYSFNAPGALLDALKELPINLYTTANNHCLDRGVKGLLATLDALDSRGMAHTGTFRNQSEKDRGCTVSLRGCEVELMSYNASINKGALRDSIGDLQPWHINNLVNPFLYAGSAESSIRFYRLRCLLGKPFSPHTIAAIKHFLGVKQRPWADGMRDRSVYENEFEEIRLAVHKARQRADLVIFMPHCGGQYNVNPGAFSRSILPEIMSFGVDAIVGHHPHVIQRVSMFGGRPCAYSLGNVTLSPSSINIVREVLPEYGMAFHLYVQNGKIVRCAYSILKAVEDMRGFPVVYPIDRLPVMSRTTLDDLKQLHQRIGNVTVEGDVVRHEHELPLPMSDENKGECNAN